MFKYLKMCKKEIQGFKNKQGMQVLHALFTGEDPTWEAWLNVDTSGFSGIANLGGNGIKLRRGFATFPSPKPTQDELCQQKEEEIDDYCSQVEEAKEITKLQMGQIRLQSKELSGFSLKDLRQLEKQLSSVKAKKDQLLMEQLELSRLQLYLGTKGIAGE
ncbi:uncharacterized protein LOC141596282 isoform X2 [Silene latifolia]|uniref:uncharacterized protein LOC141596282 isoform X2 n=1 Tax=Silene latifolia TaxID=37657 RepID=UPI003D783B58